MVYSNGHVSIYKPNYTNSFASALYFSAVHSAIIWRNIVSYIAQFTSNCFLWIKISGQQSLILVYPRPSFIRSNRINIFSEVSWLRTVTFGSHRVDVTRVMVLPSCEPSLLLCPIAPLVHSRLSAVVGRSVMRSFCK